MKRILWIFAPLILLASGCVTTPPETAEPVPAKDEPPVVQEKAPDTKIIDVYLPSLEKLVSPDGIVDGYVEYQYDKGGNLLERRELDSEHKLMTRQVNDIRGGNVVRSQWFRGEENEPGIYMVQKYDGDRLIESVSYDIKDVPQTRSSYEYNSDGNVVKWTVSSGDNVPMMVTQYEYKGLLKTAALFLSPLGQPEGHIEYQYNGDALVREITYDSDGNLDKSVEYQYENGKLVGETHYRKTVVSDRIEYELDDMGNVKVKKQIYRSGNLKALWQYEYISVKKEVRL